MQLLTFSESDWISAYIPTAMKDSYTDSTQIMGDFSSLFPPSVVEREAAPEVLGQDLGTGNRYLGALCYLAETGSCSYRLGSPHVHRAVFVSPNWLISLSSFFISSILSGGKGFLVPLIASISFESNCGVFWNSHLPVSTMWVLYCLSSCYGGHRFKPIENLY